MLEKKIRSQVVVHVLRDLVPQNVRAQYPQPMEWFRRQFVFIADNDLRAHLAEAYYQARLLQKLRVTLGLRGNFNNLFIKMQVVLYASIYEALVDHAIERHPQDQRVQKLRAFAEYRPATGALGSKTKLTMEDSNSVKLLTPCFARHSFRELKDIKFPDKLKIACELGYISREAQDFIRSVYKSRNRIHLIPAAKEGFAPDPDESRSAFAHMEHVLRVYSKRYHA